MATLPAGQPPVKLKGGIIRVRKTKNYASIDNAAIEDDLISWKARGILCYLLSRPDCWQVRMCELEKRSKRDGRESVRSGIQELMRAGYIRREKRRGTDGKIIEWTYEVREKPSVPQAGIPTVGNPSINKTEVEKKSRKPKTAFMSPTEMLIYEQKKANLPGALNCDKAEAYQEEGPLPF